MLNLEMKERSEASLKREGLSLTEVKRYREALDLLGPYAGRLEGPVLDFGASYGLSLLALATLGVEDVWGVEPDQGRVERGAKVLASSGMKGSRITHVADTRNLPFPDDHFGSVLALAVFEHIPQPRCDYLRELWRVLRPGGRLLIAETPNKYFPVDVHTTGLPLIPWLPEKVAHAIGRRWGRNRDWYSTRDKWRGSGWRGMGYYEMAGAIPGKFACEHIDCRPRHGRLRRMGLFPGLLDPYPIYAIRKEGAEVEVS